MLFAIAGHQKLYVAICRWLDQPGVGALVGENDSFLSGRIGYITFGSCEHEGDRLCKSDLEKRMDGL